MEGIRSTTARRHRSRAEKYAYWEKLWQLLEENTPILIIEITGVGSKQITHLRRALCGKATVLFGKNTLIRTGLQYRIEQPRLPDDERARDDLRELLHLVRENVGLIFCRSPVTEVQRVLEECREPAEAKVGSVALVDVILKAGETGLDPVKTAGFAALNIPTRIVKSRIEIVSDVLIVAKGTKVSSEAAAMLLKLGLRPFYRSFKLLSIYDQCCVFSPAGHPSGEQIEQQFLLGIRHVAAISMATGYPTVASLPYSLSGALRNLASIAGEASYQYLESSKCR